MGQDSGAGLPITLHLNTEKGMRGGEVQNLALVRHLTKRGGEAILVAREGSALHERAKGEGLRTVAWRPRGELDVLAAMGLRRLMKSSGARVAHAHTAHALTLALLARFGLAGVRVVASRRVSFPLRSAFSLWKYRSADAVVAVSGKVREGLLEEGLDPAKVHLIPSGVDLARFEGLPSRQEARTGLGLPEEAKVVGVVGALVSHKGHAVLIQALGRLAPQIPDLVLIILGEGPLRDDLGKEAAARGLRARFLGYVEEPAPLYPALDLLVLPSLSGEGSPGAIKEAAAAGVPVVTTDVGGAGEIFRNEKEALVVPAGDAEALGRAVYKMLTERALAEGLAASARERVKLFGIEAMAEAYMALYRRLE